MATEQETANKRENLQGWIPSLATEADLFEALEKAFDYRGDVTIRRKDGVTVEGYLFNRQTGKTLDTSFVQVFPKDNSPKLSVRYSEIAALEFTGRDTAAGKSWEAWIKKYYEKKAAGEKNIALEPEALD